MKLCRLGISFDTGSGCGGRDWELDWSFKYTGKYDSQHEVAINTVEDLTKEINEKNEWAKPEELT